jgi:hypothetical protein
MRAWLKGLGLAGVAAAVARKFMSSRPAETLTTETTSDDPGGASLGEALSDRAEGPHVPTTPDDPLVTVEPDED